MPVFNNMLAGASGGAGGAGGFQIERSIRFNASDSAYLSKTPSAAGNSKTWTLSFWVKRAGLAANNCIFMAYNGSSISEDNYATIQLNNDDTFRVGYAYASYKTTTRVFRDPSAWYHIVVVIDTTNSTAGDRVQIYVNGTKETSFSATHDPDLNQDLAWNRASFIHRLGSEYNQFYSNIYLADVHFIDGQTPGTTTDDSNGSVTGTPNAEYLTDFGEFDDNGVWQPKEFAGTYGTNGFHLDFKDYSSNAALGTDTSGNGNTWTVNNLTASSLNYSESTAASPSGSSGFSSAITNLFDSDDNTYAAANYAAGDTTDITVTFNPAVTAGSTLTTKIYQYSTYHSLKVNSGSFVVASGGVVNLLSGHGISAGDPITSITYRTTSPTSSWNLSNQWYYIKNDGVNLQSNPSSTDSLRDSPTNGTQTDTGAGGEVVGNYATLNPLDSPNSNSGSLTNGNLNLNGTVTWSGNRATIAYPSSGKWYYETQVNGSATSRGSNSQYSVVGLCQTSDSFTGSNVTNNMLWLGDNGYGRNFSSSGTTDIFGANIDGGKIIGLAVNMDNNTFEYFVDGVSKQTGTINVTSGTLLSPFMASYGNSQTSLIANFGQRAFAYTAPSGYKSLNTANLPPPTIADGSKYFDTKLWNGNGAANSQTLGFSPDLVWIKERDTSGYSHALHDNVRGPTKQLRSNTTGIESTSSTALTSFDSNGFTVNNNNISNQTSKRYVGWAWDAGDDANPTTIAVGSLNSSAYDQSQTWSSGVAGSNQTSNVQGFDGNLSTWAAPNGHSTLTWTPPATVTISSSLQIYAAREASGDSITVNFTDGSSFNSFTPDNVFRWYTVSSPSGKTISNIIWTHSTSKSKISAIEVDGKVLVDASVSITTPSIASTVRANPSAGFSIVTYSGNSVSGATIGHGLNAAPEFLIVKSRTKVDDWRVYSKAAGQGNYLRLQLSNGAASSGNWQSLSSTTFGLDGDSAVNSSSHTYVAYCFTPVEGYSAMGGYTGNGSDNGPFIYTGFRARWIMIKSYSASNSGSHNHWSIYDTARDTGNEAQTLLLASVPDPEFTNGSGYTEIDILSNGFKLRADSGGYSNYNTNQFLYLAFAEHPFKNARAR